MGTASLSVKSTQRILGLKIYTVEPCSVQSFNRRAPEDAIYAIEVYSKPITKQHKTLRTLYLTSRGKVVPSVKWR